MFAPSRAAAGGLIAYGTSQVAAIRRMAAYVEKILKGAKPGELSVETVTRYELIVNLKTAREIGVTIPPEVLKRADQIKLVADSAQRPVQLDDPHIQSGRESIEPGDAL
ncbi:MAG TPA: ABC transporter substrate binding protein [bacterium]|nr:ABC transporter substrate binding protein [bacterium]